MDRHPGVKVEQRTGNIELRFTYKGTPYSKTLPGPATPANLRRAARELAEWKAAIRLGIGVEDSTASPPFDEVAQDYLDHARRAGMKHSTVLSYRDALNCYWMDELAALPMADIPYRLLRKIDRGTAWPSEKTRKNAITALRQVFHFAVEEDVRPDNPAAQFRVRRIQPPEKAFYTDEHRVLILAWVDEHAPPSPRLFAHLAFGTGMRTGEIIALDVDDLRKRGFRVSKARVRGRIESTKTAKARTVPVGPDLRRRVLEHVGADPAGKVTRIDARRSGPLLLTQYGAPYQDGDKLVIWQRRACEALGIPYLGGRHNPYPWRHTYASRGLTRGLSPALMARTLGHSVETFLRVYADWIPQDEDDELIASLEDYEGETPEGDHGWETR